MGLRGVPGADDDHPTRPDPRSPVATFVSRDASQGTPCAPPARSALAPPAPCVRRALLALGGHAGSRWLTGRHTEGAGPKGQGLRA